MCYTGIGWPGSALGSVSQSHHLQSEQVETGLLGSFPTLLFYVILRVGEEVASKVHGFSMRWAFFKEETPCVLRLLLRIYLYNPTFRKLSIFSPTGPSLAIKRSHEVWQFGGNREQFMSVTHGSPLLTPYFLPPCLPKGRWLLRSNPEDVLGK